MTKITPPAKNAVRSARATSAAAVDAATEMKRLCQLDDADGVLAMLQELGIKTDTEIPPGYIPVVFAIAADAPSVFKALIAKDGRGRKRGLGARLYGGNTPAHLCCHILSGSAIDGGSFAPKCLAAAIAMDPLFALRLTEDRRSALATAAACLTRRLSRPSSPAWPAPSPTAPSRRRPLATSFPWPLPSQ